MNSSTKLFIILATLILIGIGTMACSSNSTASNTVKPKSAPANNIQAGQIALVDDKGNITLRFTEQEGVGLVNSLFESLGPERPENSYFTPFMQEKISWLYAEITSGRMKFEAVPTFAKNRDGTDNNSIMMSSGYSEAGQPVVTLYMPRLMSFVRLQHKIPNGFNDMVKNTFALMLIHEGVHLEKDKNFFSQNHTPAQSLEEEKRAWLKVNTGAVRPLRAKGVAIEIDWLQCDDILKACRDRMECAEFTSFISGGTPNSFGPRYN